MSIKESLTSQDPEVLLTERVSSKVKVTPSYKLVKCALVTTKDEHFILKDINKAKVEKKHWQHFE